MAMLQDVTSSAGLDHVWDKQPQQSCLQFDESLWSKLLEQLGFGILLFARGSFLEDLQDEARQFRKGAKVKVANGFEVQDPRSPAAQLLRTVVECFVHSTMMRTCQGRSMSLCTIHLHRPANRPHVMSW